MKLVTQTFALSERFGDEKAIELIADAGFDGIDYTVFPPGNGGSEIYGDNGVEYAKKLKEAADRNNITFTQAHAPFGVDDVEKLKKIVIKSIEAVSVLKPEIMVVHPLHHLPYLDNVHKLYEMNMSFYKELIPYCEEYGIKIAVENMYQTRELGRRRGRPVLDSTCASAEEFCKYIDDLGSEWVVGCLDLGHCSCTCRNPQDMLRSIGGDRIKALHLHDDDGVGDLHTLPGTVKIMNWDEICKALAEINYSGNFTLEADNFFKGYDDNFIPTALKFMHDTGRYYISKIENYKKEK